MCHFRRIYGGILVFMTIRCVSIFIFCVLAIYVNTKINAEYRLAPYVEHVGEIVHSYANEMKKELGLICVSGK
jgi:hypothetical protein